jgi:hypothetical protein
MVFKRAFFTLLLLLPGFVCLGQAGSRSLFAALKPIKKSEAILLGIDTGAKYRSLLIQFENGKVDILADVPYLASPQKDGFYYINQYQLNWHKAKEEGATDLRMEGRDTVAWSFSRSDFFISRNFQTLSDSITKEKEKAGIRNESIACTNCREYYEQEVNRLSYVIPGFISIEERSEKYAGAAHPHTTTKAFTATFTDLPNIQTSTASSFANSAVCCDQNSFKSLFSPKHWEIVQRTLYFKGIDEQFIDRNRDNEVTRKFDLTKFDGRAIGKSTSPYQIQTAAPDFVLTHERGQVHLKVRAHTTASYTESGDDQLTTEYDAGPLQKPFIRYNAFPLDFSALQSRYAGLVDAYVSPYHNVVMLVLNGEPGSIQPTLALVDVTTGKLIFTREITGSIIMAEWAADTSIEQWQQQLK